MEKPVCSFRIKYSDTDQMGIMHHSNYLKYYENARWEMLRNFGVPYTAIENEGIILPVIRAEIDYLKPALYDENIEIFMAIKSFKGPRIVYESYMQNQNGEIINKATIVLACVSKQTGKACILPTKIKNILEGLNS